MTTAVPDAVLAGAPLRAASIERLACLVRHWAWAEEAKLRFDRELAEGWDYEEDLAADRPFGSFYHWCALLSGLAEAALSSQLLSPSQLLGIRADLEDSLSDLQACRDLLIAVPSSMERHPLVIELLRDELRLERLRRLHLAFGEALRRERVARDIELLGE